MQPDEGPEVGHTFRLSVTSRMSSKVVGDPTRTDASYFGPPMVLDVRAWNLRDGLEKAAGLPLTAWQLREQTAIAEGAQRLAEAFDWIDWHLDTEETLRVLAAVVLGEEPAKADVENSAHLGWSRP